MEIDSTLRNVAGEMLGKSLHATIDVDPTPPGIGVLAGTYVVPREAGELLSIRHVNVDSVDVIVARVVDSARTRALGRGRYWWARDDITWRQTIGDSIVVRLATPGTWLEW